jgi:hypothetical protein
MMTFRVLRDCFLSWVLLAALIVLNSGCASTPKRDWNSRVGNYTFDNAVQELGPPTSSVRLQDGTTVAEWFLKHGSQMSFGFGTGMYGGGGGLGVGQSISPPPRALFLRLTFDPQGKLQRWEEVKR